MSQREPYTPPAAPELVAAAPTAASAPSGITSGADGTTNYVSLI